MTLHRRTLLALTALSPAAALAHGEKPHAKATVVRKEQKPWGIAGNATAARRTIEVRMLDTMRFGHRNAGKVMHEFVIGTPQELDEHAALMLKFPNMEHDEPYMAHVAPGKTEQIVWAFNRPGEFKFACLIAGHYAAGMVGTIVVRKDIA